MRAFIIILVLLFFKSLAQAGEVDAKSIPKSILMLGLYCNAADIELKAFYEKSPLAPPWNAQGKRADAFAKVFAGLDYNLGGNAKAIKDKALTSSEVNFLNLTAQKEAKIWGEYATVKCGLLHENSELEACLRDLNSEIFKCYQQLISQVDSASLSK